MNLYHTYSEFMAQWGNGHILVMAKNVEQAKRKILDSFEHQDRINYPHYYGVELDPEDLAEIESRRQLLKADVENFKLVESGILFIQGSH